MVGSPRAALIQVSSCLLTKNSRLADHSAIGPARSYPTRPGHAQPLGVVKYLGRSQNGRSRRAPLSELPGSEICRSPVRQQARQPTNAEPIANLRVLRANRLAEPLELMHPTFKHARSRAGGEIRLAFRSNRGEQFSL